MEKCMQSIPSIYVINIGHCKLITVIILGFCQVGLELGSGNSRAFRSRAFHNECFTSGVWVQSYSIPATQKVLNGLKEVHFQHARHCNFYFTLKKLTNNAFHFPSVPPLHMLFQDAPCRFATDNVSHH